MTINLLLIIGGIIAAGLVYARLRYRWWLEDLLYRINRDSDIGYTNMGTIEYSRYGRGAVVLVLHGTPGGYDQGMMMDEIYRAGFTLLAPSRPGYLRTPLTTAPSFEAQADALAGLLDRLGIRQAAVIGISGGGPIALQLALRHPQRVWTLVMESAVSQQYEPDPEAAQMLVGRLLLSKRLQTVFYWLMNVFAKAYPAAALREMLKAEALLDKGGIERCVKTVMSDPAQVAWFKRFVDTIVPYDMRKVGLGNDLKQLANVPPYPLQDITTPTLVIHSQVDRDVKFSHAEFVAQTVPGAELLAVEGCGHLLWLGKTGDRVRQRRLEFLRQHAPKQPDNGSTPDSKG